MLKYSFYVKEGATGAGINQKRQAFQGAKSSMQQDTPADRNKIPIRDVLVSALPETGSVLEIASGSGVHVVCFAESFPNLMWQPSDPDISARAAIVANAEQSGLTNILDPLNLDVQGESWPSTRFNALICINMVHISPWQATESLFSHAKEILLPGSPLFLYGPYNRPNIPTAESNVAFDRSLKDRNHLWGLRDVEDVSKLATTNGFQLEKTVEMPANNISILFRLA